MSIRASRRLAIFLVFALAHGAGPLRAGEPDDRLRSAANLARQGIWDDAVAALPDVSGLEREHLPLLQTVSQLLLTQRPSAAAHLLAAMRRLDPESVRPRAALESLWASNPTLDGLWLSDLDSFPVDAETISIAGSTIVTLAAKPFIRTSPIVESKTGAAYPFSTAVYRVTADRLALRVVVRFTGANSARARQVGRFLAMLADLTDPLLGPVNRARYPVPVWMEAGGKPGARQWNGAITLQAVGVERPDTEWVRQLAHEWGHACLPGVDGFREPEAWANGDLGERLFIPLMARDGRLDAWQTGMDAGAYIRRSVDPLTMAFAKTGPLAALILDKGQNGYDHLLGACLYINGAYGTPWLIAALDGAGAGNATDFMRSFSDVLAGKTRVEVARWGSPGSRPICIPRAGRYIVNGRNLRRNGTILSGAARYNSGWTMLQWDGVLTISPVEKSRGSR